MALIDLNDCFPESLTGTRGPLPKQEEFLKSLIHEGGSKYVLYCGGIGSGKTLIGCITMISLAVLYPGDYLVCRQFYPELRDTTLKTFLELCPPELIKEYRVADAIVKIKSTGGKISTVMFRQLEEAEKLRSLNLNAFYIDESSQVSEAAFMLLQGRLRGKHVRKGFLTTNPNGHDWQYNWFVKKDMFKTEESKAQFKLIKAPSTENTHLPEGYVQSMLDSWSEDRVQREIYGSFDSFSGQVYSDFRRDVHVVKPFRIPDEWNRVIGIDHGYRNPSAWVWGAIDHDENVYIYREFYKKEWLIEEICKGKTSNGIKEPGVLDLMRGEKIYNAVIDPSTKATRGTSKNGHPYSDYTEYTENLPKTLPLALANNDISVGVDRVKSFMKVDPKSNKPALYVFDTCANLIDEITNYRYPELKANETNRRNEKENPVKVNDHAVDALRYLIMSRPELPSKSDEIWKKIKYNSIEGHLHRTLQEKRNPRVKDPFGDN